MPPWEIRIVGFEIPNPFFPGVLCPGSRSRCCTLWPWIEARFTKDHEEHHLLDRPRDRPVRSALGVAVMAFYVVLFFAGGNDVIAAHFDLSVNSVTYVFRVLLFVLPVVSRLRHVPTLQGARGARPARIPISSPCSTRTAEGGYVDEAEELSPSP